MTNSDHYIVFQAPMEILHSSKHRLGECVPPCLLTTVVLSVEIITQEWWMYFIAFLSAKRMAVISRILIWRWDWSSNQRPWKDRLIGSRWAPHPEWLASMKRDEWWTFPRRNDWCPSTISNEIESYCLSELNDRLEECEVSRQTTDTYEADVSAVCLGARGLLLHWIWPKEKGKFM